LVLEQHTIPKKTDEHAYYDGGGNSQPISFCHKPLINFIGLEMNIGHFSTFTAAFAPICFLIYA